jgi:hypothetical protein
MRNFIIFALAMMSISAILLEKENLLKVKKDHSKKDLARRNGKKWGKGLKGKKWGKGLKGKKLRRPAPKNCPEFAKLLLEAKAMREARRKFLADLKLKRKALHKKMRETRKKCACKEGDKKVTVVGAQRALTETNPVVVVAPKKEVKPVVVAKRPCNKNGRSAGKRRDGQKSNKGVSKSDKHDNRDNSRRRKNAHKKSSSKSSSSKSSSSSSSRKNNKRNGNWRRNKAIKAKTALIGAAKTQ